MRSIEVIREKGFDKTDVQKIQISNSMHNGEESDNYVHSQDTENK